MARISSDGKHFEVVAPTKRRKSESAGPTAAELNQAYREKSEQNQRVEKTKKDAAYTRKYLGAKKGIAAGAKQSYLDYQAGIQQDKGKLAQLNQDYEMTPTPELKQERDALAESIKRQENALTVYKKDYLDFEASEEALRQQYSSDQQTYQQAADDQKTFQSQYAALLNSYRGDDLEELSEEVRPEVQGVQELVYISVINQATDQISEIQKKKTEIEKRVAGTFSVDPDYANEANDQYFQDLDEWEELDQAEAFWRTQLFLAEGEKDRAHQKFEALKDPDFWKYVEKGNTFLQNQLNDSFGHYVPDSDQPDYTQAQIELERDRKSLAPIDQNMIAYYYGKDENGNRATPYMESLRREINESRTKSHLEDVQTVAQEHPVIAGIYSVPEKAIGRALVFGDMMEAATLPEERKGLLADPYTPGQSKLIGSDLARQTGLEQIDNPILKKGVEDVYSIADTAPAAVMSAVGMPGMGTAYLGAMRSADSYAKAAFRGATVEDALRQAKIDGAVSMFLGNRALRGTGSGQGGFSWQPGSATQQGVSMIPLSSSLLGEVPEAGAHALINQLGAQGAFQYLMENRGFSADNALSRPSAQQAYNILKTEGLSPETSRYLLESNGYFADNLLELPSVAESGADLQSPGLKWYGTDLFHEGEINQNRAPVREEEWSHRKGKGGDYGVSWSSIDQTDYEACFSQLIDNEKVSRVISTRAGWLLNTYDGRKMETLYAIDLNDGTEIGNRVGVEGHSGVERSEKFEAKLNAAESMGSQILLIHNHPKGLPPSSTDINALLRSERAAGIVVGHDGSVYYYTKPETEIPEEDFKVAIRKYKRYTEKTAQEKALDELAERYHFTWKKLR